MASSNTRDANAARGAHSPASSGPKNAWTLAATRTRHANARSLNPSSTCPSAFFVALGRLLTSDETDDEAVDRVDANRLCCETTNGGVSGVTGEDADGLLDADIFVEDGGSE